MSEQPSHFCPHCKGRLSRGGIKTLPDGSGVRIPGERFSYVYAPYSRLWCCPGCLDVQTELPEQSEEKHVVTW